MGRAVWCALAWCWGARAEPAASAASTAVLREVVVTAKRLELIGIACTAGEGVVVDAELALAPAYRPGQLLETVPGLDVTSHSGEGKANQYLMRGYGEWNGDIRRAFDGHSGHPLPRVRTDFNAIDP